MQICYVKRIFDHHMNHRSSSVWLKTFVPIKQPIDFARWLKKQKTTWFYDNSAY